MIRVNWVFGSHYQVDPSWDLDEMKSVGPFWGSWRTWRSCGTDNVICHDFSKCRELIQRQFQDNCNFYIPSHHYQGLGRPPNVTIYHGDFTAEVDHIEDIVACHLASDHCDIMLIVGFDLAQNEPTQDRYQNHKRHNHLSLMRSIILGKSAVQWVVLDHAKKFDDRFQNLPNLTCDTIANVLKLLI